MRGKVQGAIGPSEVLGPVFLDDSFCDTYFRAPLLNSGTIAVD